MQMKQADVSVIVAFGVVIRRTIPFWLREAWNIDRILEALVNSIVMDGCTKTINIDQDCQYVKYEAVVVIVLIGYPVVYWWKGFSLYEVWIEGCKES